MRSFLLWALIGLVIIAVAIPYAVRAQTRQTPVDTWLFDLKNPDPERRKDAVKALGNNKVVKAIPDLVAAVSDNSPAVRREIAIALDKMLNVAALPGFVALSADADKETRERCIDGIINLYIPQESGIFVNLNRVANFLNPWSDEWGEIVVEPGIRVDESAVSAVGQRLSDEDTGLRLKAARALGILRSKSAVPALLTALKQDQSYAMRFEIIRAARKIGDVSAAPGIRPYITYHDNKVRNEAVFALGRLRYKDAVAELLGLYEKERALPSGLIDKTYCGFLLDALAFIADPAAKELLVKEQQNPDDTLRMHAFEGLARIGDAAMAPEISRAWLNEKEPRVKTAQAFALYRMGRKEFLDELVRALGNSRTNIEARGLILEFKREELPDLYAQSKNNDENVREALAEIYGLIGDERAVPVLQNLASDKRGQIAALANQAMRRINARAQ